MILTKFQSEIVKLIRQGATLYEKKPKGLFFNFELKMNKKRIRIPLTTVESLVDHRVLEESGETPERKYSLTEIGHKATLWENRKLAKVIPVEIKEQMYQHFKKTGASMAELKNKFNMSAAYASDIITEYMERDKKQRYGKEEVK